MYMTKSILNSKTVFRNVISKLNSKRLPRVSSSVITLQSRNIHLCTNVLYQSNYQNLTISKKLRHLELSSTFKDYNNYSLRYFSTKHSDDGPPHEEENFNSQLPATVAVPEVWPHVPVIAISRNIVFPRFIKLIEVFNYHIHL